MTDFVPTVSVVDDDPDVRDAVARVLKAAGLRAEVFASAEEFLTRPLPDEPGCAVIDLHMPGLGGLDLYRTLTERGVGLSAVFLTGNGDIPTAVRAIRAGAVDFLTKPFDADDLLAAVRRGLARSEEVRASAADETDLRRRAESLTPREREVMDLVVTGLLNKQVGQRLGVVERTVKVHRQRVMQKMRARSLADLVRMAGRLNPAGQPAARSCR